MSLLLGGGGGGGGLMRGIKTPQYEFALKMQGGLMREGGRICGTLRYKTFDSACRSQVGIISKLFMGFGAGKVVVYYGFRHA